MGSMAPGWQRRDGQEAFGHSRLCREEGNNHDFCPKPSTGAAAVPRRSDLNPRADSWQATPRTLNPTLT